MINTSHRLSIRGVYLRGIAMGAADIVPGVSGGTIALITGIYDRLLNAITAADVTALSLLLRGRISDVWLRLDGQFLTTLLAGIATAVVVLANAIQWLLATQPLFLWSFFFGLVGASSMVLWRQERLIFDVYHVLIATLGVLLALAISLAPPQAFDATNLGFFMAGALAICAMILPGISGSFVLLLLGMYGPVITAITEGDLLRLMLFGMGCIVGLALFARLLRRLLARFRSFTMALLAGFLAGSLVALWPWQVTVAAAVDRHGVGRAVQSLPVTPEYYAQSVGDSQWLGCVLIAVSGAVLVVLSQWWLERSDGGGQ